MCSSRRPSRALRVWDAAEHGVGGSDEPCADVSGESSGILCLLRPLPPHYVDHCSNTTFASPVCGSEETPHAKRGQLDLSGDLPIDASSVFSDVCVGQGKTV